MTPDRADRIADFIRAQLASVVLTQMRDLRVSMLSVTDVSVSRDFAVADVYVSSVEATDKAAQQELVAVLRKAAGFLRTAVAKRQGWRKTPRLRFHYDDLPERGARINALIDHAVSLDQSNVQARSGSHGT